MVEDEKCLRFRVCFHINQEMVVEDVEKKLECGLFGNANSSQSRRRHKWFRLISGVCTRAHTNKCFLLRWKVFTHNDFCARRHN